MKNAKFEWCFRTAVSVTAVLISVNAAAAQIARPIDEARVIEYWTPERRAEAIPRDLVLDTPDLGYLRRPDGRLVPYGHDIPAQAAPTNQTISPFGFSSVFSNAAPRMFRKMDPGENATVGASHPFSSTITEGTGGIQSVKFNIQKDGSPFIKSFSTTKSPASDTWVASVVGLTKGTWRWWVVSKRLTSKGASTTTSQVLHFTVDATRGGSSSAGGASCRDIVTRGLWNTGGTVRAALGRLYFEMPNSANREGSWTAYVCSGTAVTDGTDRRSIIITAAHCVYDDLNKAFARNVMFVPGQADTSDSPTERSDGYDRPSQWAPSFGVVDKEWTSRTFPANTAWDYGFYVANDLAAHSTTSARTFENGALDEAAGSVPIRFTSIAANNASMEADTADYTYALGYSYNQDRRVLYCAEDIDTTGGVNWWLANCRLSGGSTGGPWLQPVKSGNGTIVTINSWGYAKRPGMAGPKLVGTTASCVFENAKAEPFPIAVLDGDAGYAITCP